MPLHKILPSIAILLCLMLPACGDQNPLIGSWQLDTQDESVYLRLGISLATSGQSLSVVFDEAEMRVNYGRGAENFKVTYTRNSDTKVWSFCLNDGNNCFPAVFSDEKLNRVSFPLYGISMKFIRQAE
jgi:hypothetical protein